jgi:hypothetical protein
MNYALFLFSMGFISMCGSFSHLPAHTAVQQAPAEPEQTPEAKGAKALQTLLDIHRSGIAYDYSDSLPAPKSYLGWLKYRRKRLDTKPASVIHHDAVDLFSKSSFLATASIPEVFPVAEGAQLVQDLEIIAGKQRGQSCLSAVLPVTQSHVGQVSLALLLATPQSDGAVLKKRQQAIQALMKNAEVCEYLGEIYKEFAQKERYCLPVLAAQDGAPRNHFDTGALVLNLPLFRRLKKHSGIRTANDWIGLYSNIFWFGLLGCAIYKMSAYAYRALQAPSDAKVEGGTLLTPDQVASVETRKEYMMPDVRLMWKMSDSPKWRASLALLSAGFCVYWGYQGGRNFIGGLLDKKLQWYSLMQAACGFRSMRQAYTEIAASEEMRALPDCSFLFDFFEKKLKADLELAELCRLFDSLPLNPSTGNFLLSGYVGRAYELLGKKSSELAYLTVCFARLEIYVGLANLMRQDVSEVKNKYAFVTYAGADEGAVFEAKGLWNPLIAREKAVSNSVCLGGKSSVRNYMLTGLNAGGKSTFIKLLGIGALMAQTVGIVPAESCHMSVFAVIETYLNITDDVQQGNSLFKKEVMRAAALLKRAEQAQGKPSLLIFDEMFSGTTPYEGVSCAYSVAQYIAQQPSVLSCIATHFMYLTQLARKYSSVENKCVRLEPVDASSVDIRRRANASKILM